MNTEELLKKLDADRDAYLATFQQVHEALAKAIIANASTSTSTSTPTPALPSRPVLDRVSRLSISESERKASAAVSLSGPSTFKTSIISGDEEELSDDDEALYVQDLLPATHFDDEHFRTHLKTYQWNNFARQILEPILTKEGRLKFPDLFPLGQNPNEDRSHYSLYQVFDVGSDGAPLPLHTDSVITKVNKGQTMWNFIKVATICSSFRHNLTLLLQDINVDSARRRKAVGRITCVPPPFCHVRIVD